MNNDDIPRRRDKCACGKICFDKKDAATKRNYLSKIGNARNLRIYQCPMSSTWHLSSVTNWYSEPKWKYKPLRRNKR